MFDNLSVQEIVEKIASGITEPYLCRLNDERLYALKGRQALARGLIAEIVCAQLGTRIGLPIPEFAVASVDIELISASGDDDFNYAVGPGCAFASLWRDSTIPINRSWLQRIDRSTLARVYVFDHWIRNGDRTLTELGGNPNLLIDLASDTLVVIDHNLAFSNTYDPSELQLHACRQAWLDEAADLVFKQECEASMAASLADIPAIFTSLPAQWHDAEPDMETEIVSILNRFRNPEFWDELR